MAKHSNWSIRRYALDHWGGIGTRRGEAEFNFLMLKRTVGGAAFFGSALGLLYGLRLLVRIAFTRTGHMRKDDRWLGLDISIGLFAAILWSGGAALILGGNSVDFTLVRFVGLTLFGTV